MRKIVIMRGAPGTMKSSIIKMAGLQYNCLSADAVRICYAGMEMTPTGRVTIAASADSQVWAFIRQSLAYRFNRGETFVFDATNAKIKDFNSVVKMARENQYEILVVDRSKCDRVKSFERNCNRPEPEVVPIYSFDSLWDDISKSAITDKDLNILSTGEDFEASVIGIQKFLHTDMTPADFSSYDRIVHVGDLQGCLAPLISDESPLMKHFDDPKTMFLFVGDLFDRGIENGALARWWIDNMIGRENVMLIAGNHETHLELEAYGRPHVSREFRTRTLAQFNEAEITASEIKAIADSTVDLVHYRWNGTRVLVSHGGFSKFPDPLWALPEEQLRKGNGYHSSEIDRYWTEWNEGNKDKIYQVHGHRNSAMLPSHASTYSFNLEGQVEFGGCMRFAILDNNGWNTVDVRNHVHRPMQEFTAINEAEKRSSYGKTPPTAPWIRREANPLQPISEKSFEELTSSDLINSTQSETFPHISSFNFSKNVFFDAIWNSMTVKARGLFINTDNLTISARSYPKFFNHGEREETQDDALKDSIKYPVKAYIKENGFLGITGYDEKTKKLIIASKSRIDGEFPERFDRILRDVLGEAGIERLMRFNRDQIASCVFEVIDPVEDPHIIDEPEARVVLLDAIWRNETFENMDYPDLEKLAKYIGCEVKQPAFNNIKDWKAFEPIMRNVEENPSWRPKRNSGPVEGIVFVDANNFHMKSKAHFYALWKRARGAKDYVLRARKKKATVSLSRYDDEPLIKGFVEWCEKQPDDVLQRDIVELRAIYLEDPELIVESRLPAPKPEVPDQTGFIKGLDAIAAQIEAGKAKSASAARIIERALEDEHRKKAFENHPQAAKIKAFAELNAE